MKSFPAIYFYIGKKGIHTIAGPQGADLKAGPEGIRLILGAECLYTTTEKTAEQTNQSNEIAANSGNIIPSSAHEVTVIDQIAGLKEIFEGVIKQRKAKGDEIVETESKLNTLLSNLEKKESSFLSKLFTQKETFEKLDKEIQETAAYIVEAKKQLEECRINLQFTFDPDLQAEYQNVNRAFQKLGTSNKLWVVEKQIPNSSSNSDVTEYVVRKEVQFNNGKVDFIHSAIPGMHIQNDSDIQIFIFPSFCLTIDVSGNLSLYDLNEICFWFKAQRFHETPGEVPSDATIADDNLDSVGKKGRRKKRTADTNQVEKVTYGVYNISARNSLKQTYYVSNYSFAETFAAEFLNYFSSLPSTPVSSINQAFSVAKVKKKDFEKIKTFADNHLKLIFGFRDNKPIMDQIFSIPSMKSSNLKTPSQFVNFYMMLDLMKCFEIIVDLKDLKTKEAFALLYVLAKSNEVEIDRYAQYALLYSLNIVSMYEETFEIVQPELDKELPDHKVFRLAHIFSSFDKDLQEQYLSSLYRFASIVVKIDGTVSPKEENALKRIMNLNPNADAVSKKAEAEQIKQNVTDVTDAKSIEETLEELNSLTGLTEVKKEINTLINFIKVQKARADKGLKTSSVSYHIVFMGNPGTGKTTVARIVSQIYKSLGVLTQGQLVETDRSGLIAEYVGQTAVKVNKTVDTALHGVLFIDEAYSIVGDAQDSFGREAVSTLIKRMEDDRDKLIVILAGYTKEMQDFIDTNPGFKSRFNRYIEFADYTPVELLAIFEGLCKKLDYKPTPDAKVKLSELFQKAYENRDKSFGNGRFVRNTFEKAMELQANRIAGVGELTDEVLTTITVDDIP